MGRICSTYLQFEDRHYKLMESLSVIQGLWYSGLYVGRVQHSDGFQGNMPAYSLGLGAVYVGTFRKLACYRSVLGRCIATRNYIVVCTACALTSIPKTSVCM